MTSRRGHTLVELLVAMPLGLLVLALLSAAAVAQLRFARRLADHVARSEVARASGWILQEELRWTAPGDVRGATRDSFRTRVFRGVALPCVADPRAVSWIGLREPAAERDSLLVLSPDAEVAAAVASVSGSAACGGFRLTLDRALPVAPALLFETGTYYVQERALRYRIGGEGRQALTQELLDSRSALRVDARGTPASLELLLPPLRGEVGAGWRHSVRWLLPNFLTSVR